MRLIHTDNFTMEEFNKGLPPTYAILSHTWRTHEVTFQDFNNFAAARLPPRKVNGNYLAYVSRLCHHEYQLFDKIIRVCQLARKRGIMYVWVDTCCIDKSNSAELGESINSMFEWYERSEICYVYLKDFELGQNGNIETSVFRECLWFKRAWTLQELLAAQWVLFFDRSWNELGEKRFFGPLLSDITGIEIPFLARTVSIHTASVAKRMSWAAAREASREEDKAYSLLGIFGVNMPLIYGERSKAFIRLQEEILKESDDHSIFAWMEHPGTQQKSIIRTCGEPSCEDPAHDASVCANLRCTSSTCIIAMKNNDHGSVQGRVLADRQLRGLFATSPNDFKNSGNITSFPQAKAKGHITITNRGIHMPSMLSFELIQGREVPVLVLNCSAGEYDPIGIYLHHEAGDQYTRAWPNRLISCTSEARETIYGLKTLSTFRSAAGSPLENSIILNVFEVPEYIYVLEMPPTMLNRERKPFFPTGGIVPYSNSLMVAKGDVRVRIWFGTKQQGKDKEVLPWCRCQKVFGRGPIPIRQQLSILQPPPPMHQPSMLQQPFVRAQSPMPSGSARPQIPAHIRVPWNLEDCESDDCMGLDPNEELYITINQRREQGFDVFYLEIRTRRSQV